MSKQIDPQHKTRESVSLAGSDPWEIFGAWFAEAQRQEINDPNAMSLATIDQSGMPNIRIVLMKDFDRRGCVFYTNLSSAKGTELQATHRAAASFHWKTLKRQVRLRGDVEPVSRQRSR